MPVGVNVSASVLCVRYVCHGGYLFVSACKEERRCVCVRACMFAFVRVRVRTCTHVSIAAADVGHYSLLSPRGHAAGEDRREGAEVVGKMGEGGDG